MPDFDVDFCQQRRAEVIDYVTEKYGKERVGEIVTFGKLQAKAAIRDVSRVFSLPTLKLICFLSLFLKSWGSLSTRL